MIVIALFCSCSKRSEYLGNYLPDILQDNFKPYYAGSDRIKGNLKTDPDLDFNETLFDHFLLMDSLLIDDQFNDYLIDNHFYSDSDIVKFTDFLAIFNSYARHEVYSQNQLFQINHDSNMYVRGYQYYPIINIVNFQILNSSYDPIRSFGYDLPDVDDSISDVIYGRYYSNHQLYEIEVDESDAANVYIPILIMTNDLDDYQQSTMKKIKIVDSELDQNYKNQNSLDYPYFSEYKIDYRYESSERSEYTEEVWFYYSNGSNHENGNPEVIKKIHKKDVGNTTFYNEVEIPHWGDNITGYWIVTFEYDWWAGRKKIAVGSSPAPYIRVLECRMKFKDEDYQTGFFFIPTPGGNSVTFNSKGHCTITTN